MNITLETLEAMIIVFLGILAIVAGINGQLEMESMIAGGLLGFIGSDLKRKTDENDAIA